VRAASSVATAQRTPLNIPHDLSIAAQCIQPPLGLLGRQLGADGLLDSRVHRALHRIICAEPALALVSHPKVDGKVVAVRSG
jgi:hypothetical protein